MFVSLSEIPHIDSNELAGRFVAAFLFYSEENWSGWLQTEKGFIESKNMWPAEATYYADKSEKDTDITFHFLDFLAQRANYLESMKPYMGILDDIICSRLPKPFAKTWEKKFRLLLPPTMRNIC